MKKLVLLLGIFLSHAGFSQQNVLQPDAAASPAAIDNSNEEVALSTNSLIYAVDLFKGLNFSAIKLSQTVASEQLEKLKSSGDFATMIKETTSLFSALPTSTYKSGWATKKKFFSNMNKSADEKAYLRNLVLLEKQLSPAALKADWLKRRPTWLSEIGSFLKK